MQRSFRLLVLLGATMVGAVTAASPVVAEGDDGAGSALFVQTNDPAGNAIDVFHRNADGTLTFVHGYPTGGLGGRAAGSASDPLASQGSLVLVREENLLLAVNAGSGSVSAFKVEGDRLRLSQVVSSGGPFPAAIAIHDDLAYVLDAGGDGFVSGFRISEGGLRPISGSTRALGLGNAPVPFFLSSPAQVGFSPDGDHLIVTTKTHNTVDVFGIGSDGAPSATAVKNAAAPVPFAFVFDSAEHLVLNFAGTSSLATFAINDDNTITPVAAAVSDTRAALCWVTPAARFLYGSNTGTGDVSQFRVTDDGAVTLVNPIAASGVPGATDSSAAGRFLYVQSGGTGTVHVFRIGDGGALTPIQVTTVPAGASQEGIAAG